MIQKLFHHKYTRLSLVVFALLSLVFLINVGVSNSRPIDINVDPTEYYAIRNYLYYNSVAYAFNYVGRTAWIGTIACFITGILFLINQRYMKTFLISYTMIYQTLLFTALKIFTAPYRHEFSWLTYLLFFMSIGCNIIVWYGYQELTKHEIVTIQTKNLFSKTKFITILLSVVTLIIALITDSSPLSSMAILYSHYTVSLYGLTLILAVIWMHKSYLFTILFKGTLINLYLMCLTGFLSADKWFNIPNNLFNVQNGLLFTLSLVTITLAWQFSDNILFNKTNKHLLKVA